MSDELRILLRQLKAQTAHLTTIVHWAAIISLALSTVAIIIALSVLLIGGGR
jgi:ABC-type lipoprotein release transport system permease subunit